MTDSVPQTNPNGNHAKERTMDDYEKYLEQREKDSENPILCALEALEMCGPGNSKAQLLNQIQYARGCLRTALQPKEDAA